MVKLKEENLKGRIANLELIVSKLQEQINILIKQVWKEEDFGQIDDKEFAQL